VAFTDKDPLEDLMGARVERMTPHQLVEYVQTYQEAFGISLKVQKFAEDQVFSDLQETYGKRDAGRIVKWAFYSGGPYQGSFRERPIAFRDFAKGRKWWTDQLHVEMQQHLAKPKVSVKTYEKTEGSVQLADL
jgi:hypothetical protein